MALLPQLPQTEFRPLLDDLEAQLEQAGRQRGGLRRLLDEIRAIDKCVRFELAVSQQDVPVQHPERGAESESHRRLDLATTAEPHSHLFRPQTKTSAQDA
jgi:hypothetical protein